MLETAFRLNPGAGEDERDTGGDGGNSGAGGVESDPKILKVVHKSRSASDILKNTYC